MTLIYDNLISAVVAMTVTLILASVQLRATHHRMAARAQYVMTERVTGLSSWLQRDLERIGENKTGGSVPIDTLILPSNDSTAQWLTDRFVFERDSITPSGSPVPVKIRYDIQNMGSRTVQGETTDEYRFQRKRKVGANAWESAGGSTAPLGYFDVDLLNKNAEPVENPEIHLQTHPDTVRSVRVRFSVLPPFDNNQLSVGTSHTNAVIARYPSADS